MTMSLCSVDSAIILGYVCYVDKGIIRESNK